jgi:ketosteroid isomerase-like protein
MSESTSETVRRLFERFERDGLEPALDLISEDFVVEVPGSMSAEPDVYKGHDGARRYFAGFDGLMEEVRFEPIEMVEQGGALIVWLRLSGRGAASGIQVDQHAAVVTWVEDGKVTRMELYPEMDGARKALGA